MGGKAFYKLGVYDFDGKLKCLRTVFTKKDAEKAYKCLKEEQSCTIWVQKIEFVNPKEEFAE